MKRLCVFAVLWFLFCGSGVPYAHSYSPIADAVDSEDDEAESPASQDAEDAEPVVEDREETPYDVDAPFEDAGDFVLRFEDIKDRELRGVTQLLADMGRFELLIEDLNNNVILPYDITVRFRNGGDFEAYFDPESEQITISYEFVALIAGVFLKNEYIDLEESPEDFVYVLDVVESILYHEIGHALVHALDIPITGKEEDAVDALSAIVIALLLEEPENLVSAAHFYAMMAEEREDFEESDFWDEHSLDEQRYYNMVCWIYGSDPKKFADLPEEEGLGEDRAERCQEEYEQISRSWMTLLSPYWKEE